MLAGLDEDILGDLVLGGVRFLDLPRSSSRSDNGVRLEWRGLGDGSRRCLSLSREGVRSSTPGRNLAE